MSDMPFAQCDVQNAEWWVQPTAHSGIYYSSLI